MADARAVASHVALAGKIGGFGLPVDSPGPPVWETSGRDEAAAFLRRAVELAKVPHELHDTPDATYTTAVKSSSKSASSSARGTSS